MKEMKVSKKLTMGFGVVIILVIILAAYSIVSSEILDNNYLYMIENSQQRLDILLRVNSNFALARRALAYMGVFSGLDGAEENINEQLDVINKLVIDINEKLDKYSELIKSDKNLSEAEENNRTSSVSEIKSYITQWQNKIVSPVTQANLEGRREDVIEIFKEANQISDNLFNTVETLLANEQATSDNTKKNTSGSATRFIVILAIISVIIIIACVALAIIISRSIMTALKDSIQNISRVADTIAVSAHQLNDGSTQLAEGASEQAASIEETSATMNQTSAMITQNAESVQLVADLAVAHIDAAASGITKAEKMINFMERLNKSSNEVNNIVSTINSIASQTNILALNAAVEAVRAGEAGKSFTVVAEEVRNLAKKSTMAAESTTVIIKENIELAKQGMEDSKEMVGAWKEVKEGAEKAAQFLSEIAVASEEQSRGAQQINIAISQMEKATQSSAAVAQQTSASANEMFNYSTELTQEISKL